MPPFCEEHGIYHGLLLNDECGDMRRAAHRARVAAVRQAQADRIARDALDASAYVPGDRLSFTRALEVATRAALAALNEGAKP